MTEQELKTLIIHYLNAKGHFAWVNNSGLVRNTYKNKSGQIKERAWRAGVKGGSDILGIAKDGRFIAIECKVGTNKPTDLQEYFLDEIKRRGGYAIVAYTLDDVARYL
jgi:hypothetical protein